LVVHLGSELCIGRVTGIKSSSSISIGVKATKQQTNTINANEQESSTNTINTKKFVLAIDVDIYHVVL
jgi:hypothetical protein